MSTPTRRLTINESVVDAHVGDEAVLLHVARGVYYGLDPVGTRIWELLTHGTSEDAIVDQLLREYDVDLDQVRRDVATFLAALAAKGLMQEVRG